MNWYKIKDMRINLNNIAFYETFETFGIFFYTQSDSVLISFDSKEERDEELRKLDEALEKGLHTISEFKLP